MSIRLSINIADDCARFLQREKEDNGVSVTEATHRALRLLEFFQQISTAGQSVLLVDADGTTRQTLSLVPSLKDLPGPN